MILFLRRLLKFFEGLFYKCDLRAIPEVQNLILSSFGELATFQRCQKLFSPWS